MSIKSKISIKYQVFRYDQSIFTQSRKKDIQEVRLFETSFSYKIYTFPVKSIFLYILYFYILFKYQISIKSKISIKYQVFRYDKPIFTQSRQKVRDLIFIQNVYFSSKIDKFYKFYILYFIQMSIKSRISIKYQVFRYDKPIFIQSRKKDIQEVLLFETSFPQLSHTFPLKMSFPMKYFVIGYI